MFDPNALKKRKEEEQIKRQACEAVKQKCLHLIPMELQANLLINVVEQACGDPNCSPVDTMVSLTWTQYETGGRGYFAMPLEASMIDDEDIVEYFPSQEVIAAWAAGQDAEWPPRPELRFQIGERVECRIGPDPIKGWAPGRVTQHYYTQAGWPPGTYAPYQIWLHDGRMIFAPQDTDAVIRARPDPSDLDCPPSPPMPDQYKDYMEDLSDNNQ